MENNLNEQNSTHILPMINEKERMTTEQADIIIDFMATHTAFAFNKSIGCNPKAVKNRLWNELKTLVDQARGSPKTVDQIQNWWSRNKSGAKKYNGERKTLLKATGNPLNQIPISSRFEKILSITGSSHKQGLEIIPEVGCQNEEAAVNTCEAPSVKNKNIVVSLGQKRKIDISGSTNTNKANVETTLPGNQVSLKKRIISIPQVSALTSSLDHSTKQASKPVNTYLHSSSTAKSNESQISVLVGNKSFFSNSPKNLTLAQRKSSISSKGQRIDTKINHNSKVISSAQGENTIKQEYKQSFLGKMQNIASSCSPKTSFTQARSQMTMQALAEGSDSVRSFTKAFVEVSSARNALLQEQNNILRDISSKIK